MKSSNRPDNRITAAAKWLIADDSAYSNDHEAAYRAAREMLEAADLADEISIGPRLSAARDRALRVLNADGSIARSAFVQALAAEVNLPASSDLEGAADRILADLYIRGFLFKADVFCGGPA